MGINYKIEYKIFEEYFSQYNLKEFGSIIKINKLANYLSRISFSMLVFWIVFVFILIIIILRFIANLIINSLIRLLIQKTWSWKNTLFETIKFNYTDVIIVSLVLVTGLFVIFYIRSRVKFEMPYIFRDMINDRRHILMNFGKRRPPLENNFFAVLASLKYQGDIGGVHKYIPGYSTPTSFSDAKSKLKETKINGVNILNDNDEYVSWKFTIIDKKRALSGDKKKQFQCLLKELWEECLKREYDLLEYRKKQMKKRY